jgi:hypothetical protein
VKLNCTHIKIASRGLHAPLGRLCSFARARVVLKVERWGLLCLCLFPAVAGAQHETLYPDYQDRHGERFSVSICGGVSKYFGEFADDQIGNASTATAMISLHPSFDIGVTASIGKALYERRQRRHFYDTYELQFNTKSPRMASTPYFSTGLISLVRLYPAHYLDMYLMLGGGISVFTPSDYIDRLARYMPDNPTLTAVDLAGGLGFELSLWQQLALTLEATNHLLLTDRFDAFDSEVLTMNLEGADHDNPQKQNYDFYLEICLGMRYYFDLPFLARADQADQRAFIDSDRDGLSDFEEETIYHSDPMKRDTDDDGLTDFDEIAVHHTRHDLADTDGDGLGDFDEITRYGTNPLAADSDGDSLSDSLEIASGTDPLNADTDRDGLRDDVESKSGRSDPRLADSDGDGLGDMEEILKANTDPRQPDTDADGLSDYEEVVRYLTNPLRADTDGDGVSDYDEVKKFGSDPNNPKDTGTPAGGSPGAPSPQLPR